MGKEKTKTEKSEEKKGSGHKMLVRIGVGLACALFAIFLLVLVGYGEIRWIGFVMSAASALSIHEVMGVTGCKNRTLYHTMMTFSALVPVYYSFRINEILEAKVPGITGILATVYIFIIMIMMLKMYTRTRFDHVAIGLFMSIAVPLAVSCLTFTFFYMDSKDIFCRSQVIFVLLISMYCAWLNDTFALFFGSAFGKHKMAPNISPKKSVEGAVAGVVGTTVFSLITYFICRKWFFHADVINSITWWMVLIIVPVVCVMAICGDLAASVIKRNCGVKDFGTLLPEHGGALDRIDSFLFAAPATYIIVRFLTEIFG